MESREIYDTTVNGVNYKFRDGGAARIGDLADEIVNREAADSQLGAELGQKQAALTESQLAAVNSGVDSAKVSQINTNSENISALDVALDEVEDKIPEQASAQNQLADKSFVNSSVQTATANFRGNWANFAAVPTDPSLYPADYAGSTTPTTNDYLVVQDASDFPVAQGEPALEGTWRLKYTGDWATAGKNGWEPEYQVNETPLTSDQLAALNSGITQNAVQKLSTVQPNAEPNEIDSVSINGTPVTPDASKNVDLSIPTSPVKVLTDADFNYPTENPDSIAIWLLDAGIYTLPPGVAYHLTGGTTASTLTETGTFFLGPYSDTSASRTRPFIALLRSGSSGGVLSGYMSPSGNIQAPTNYDDPRQILSLGNTQNDLSAQNNLAGQRRPLSAYQGAILKAMIDGRIQTNAGAPTTATVGTVGQIFADTTNGKLYICTAVTPGTDPDPDTYTWEEVGGSGGIKILTTADYDYHFSGAVNDGIALWRLPDGLYSAGTGVKAYPFATNNTFVGSPIISVRTNAWATRLKDICWAGNAIVNGDAGWAGEASVSASSGAVQVTGKDYNRGGSDFQVLTRKSIIDELISNTEAISYNAYYRHAPLSAYQGKVLNDKIGGELSNLATTDKTSLILALNELAARVAALEGN